MIFPPSTVTEASNGLQDVLDSGDLAENRIHSSDDVEAIEQGNSRPEEEARHTRTNLHLEKEGRLHKQHQNIPHKFGHFVPRCDRFWWQPQ